MKLKLFFAALLALLVSNAAGGFASGLAGGLAFAATAVLCALFQISGLNRLNSLHGISLLLHFDIPIITRFFPFVKGFYRISKQDASPFVPIKCKGIPALLYAAAISTAVSSTRSPGTSKGIPGGYAHR